MKPPLLADDESRFSGHLRHYHRSGSKRQTSWDEWVDGKASNRSVSKKWLKIFGVLIALIALAGIVTGLIIELR
ncbi:MAG: hypothetical protein ABI162_01965 [Luteolibacter sp.]